MTMRSFNKAILVAMVVCMGLADLSGAGSEVKRPYRDKKRIKTSAMYNKGRVIHFPPDRSMGKLLMKDIGDWEYLSKARGAVFVPAGKRLALCVSQEGWQDLSPLSKLDPNDLHWLRFWRSSWDPNAKVTKAGDSCMPHIAHLTGLKELDLGDTYVTAKGLRYIGKMQSLGYLNLPMGIKNSGLGIVVSRLKSLKKLRYNGKSLTNRGLSLLAKLPSLEELEFGVTKFDDKGLAHLAKLPSLRDLTLFGPNFSDDGMVYLKDISSLRTLDVSLVPLITDVGVMHLSQLDKLENISFSRNKNITNQGAVYLSRMKSLKTLDVGNSQINDDGVAHLIKIKTLERLKLPGKGISDRSRASLMRLPNIKSLNIQRKDPVNAGTAKKENNDNECKQLGKLHLLESLSIGGSGITDVWMDQVAKLTNLKKLRLSGCSITNYGLARLSTLKSLKELHISSLNNVTTHGFARLRALKSLKELYIGFLNNVTMSGLSNLNGMENLTKLKVVNINIVQDNSVLDISGLGNLEELRLTTSRKSKEAFRNEDLACLAKLKNLKKLSVGSSTIKYGKVAISDSGMAHLAGLTNVETLTIGGPDLTDKGLKYLRNMKKLQRLFIYAGDLTDMGLRRLQRLPALTNLEIYRQDNFSDVAVRRLKRKFPKLYLRIWPASR